MGWKNPPIPWKELERRLSDGRRRNVPPGAEGDSPAWSRKRQPYEPPTTIERRDSLHVPYAEFHCHSAFSFLDGASHPEELAEEAARLGLDALALTDHDGMYGVVRFAEAARPVRVPTIFGPDRSGVRVRSAAHRAESAAVSGPAGTDGSDMAAPAHL